MKCVFSLSREPAYVRDVTAGGIDKHRTEVNARPMLGLHVLQL